MGTTAVGAITSISGTGGNGSNGKGTGLGGQGGQGGQGGRIMVFQLAYGTFYESENIASTPAVPSLPVTLTASSGSAGVTVTGNL